MLVIGISGRKGSGKSTLASNLLASSFRWTGKIARELSFADPLKQDLLARFPVDSRLVYGTDADKQSIVPGTQITIREALRRLGATYDLMEPGHHARLMRQRLVDCGKILSPSFIVVSDCRFVVELRMLRSIGARLVRLTRAIDPSDDHRSEVEADSWTDWDLVVDNDPLTPELTLGVVREALQDWRFI